MESIQPRDSSVAQASCYFGYVIAVHRTLLKLGEYLLNLSENNVKYLLSFDLFFSNTCSCTCKS